MARKMVTDAEMWAEDARLSERNARQRRLMSYDQKLDAAGIDLDELIELIEARQNRSY